MGRNKQNFLLTLGNATIIGAVVFKALAAQVRALSIAVTESRTPENGEDFLLGSRCLVSDMKHFTSVS